MKLQDSKEFVTINERRNYEIEILRAIAIIFVIVGHVPFFLIWHPNIPVLYTNFGFWDGVDLFFCISGFVIMNSVHGQLYSADRQSYLVKVGGFWIKRYFRLTPSAFFWSTFNIFMSVFPLPFAIFGLPWPNFKDTMSVLFYFANFRVYECVAQTPGMICGGGSIYWSLSLEEQFYIVLPFLIYFLRKKIWVLAILAIAIQFPLYRPMFSFLWVVRTDAIFWGILIAIFSLSPLYQIVRPTFLRDFRVRFVFVIFCIVTLSAFGDYGVVTFNVGLIALISAVLVWVASYNEGLLFKNARRMRVMLWVGSRSYTIYLAHFPAFWLVVNACIMYAGSLDAVSSKYTLFILGGGTLLTVAFTELSFRLLETPLRLKGRKLSQQFQGVARDRAAAETN